MTIPLSKVKNPNYMSESLMRTYQIYTYGCQMNLHDSERLSGLLEAAGYQPAINCNKPDVIVFNTCAVRENADNKLYGNLSHLASYKRDNPNIQIAVGGCLAQKDQDLILNYAPWVDVIFGTNNSVSLPILLDRARHNNIAQFEILETLQEFPSNLPAKRESSYSSWISISVGCNNTCAFCIVPSLRGKEVDRLPNQILAELHMLANQGVIEITLLGQNVNSYGVNLFGKKGLIKKSINSPNMQYKHGRFSNLLRSCGEIDGIERIRFTSPHPAEFTDDVIDSMAQTHNICPSLHMPLQSGSDCILKAMRRSYRIERYLKIIDKVRSAIPNIAITTDIIVGFPGETEKDFQLTLDIIKNVRFVSAFTFKYSARPGTIAESMLNHIPKKVIADRYKRLINLQDKISLEENQLCLNNKTEVLVTGYSGRKDISNCRMSGRARDGRLVHFNPGVNSNIIRPGDIIITKITKVAPHHIIADMPVEAHRRTRAGDIYEYKYNLRSSVNLGPSKLGKCA